MRHMKMSNVMKKSLIISGLALLAACANTNIDYAKAGDWDAVGYSDGIKGKLPRTTINFKGYSGVNINDYDDGYLRGVKEYCNPDHAYQIGLMGNYYEGVCENTKDAQKFRMEWRRGWIDYQGRNLD
ncbi:MAG: DUF2799 domain-containing protein [Vibrio sp.]